MADGQLKARVFISCGQKKNSEEVQIARAIAGELTRLGYEPYVATEEQTLRGVKENIFHQLETSEYFLFIDFKRERLVLSDGESVHRGSLFSHQEVALASYLDIPLVAFQEKGVKQEDGLMRFLQGNSIPFADRQLLSKLVIDEVQKKGWDPGWKNQLILEREEGLFSDATRLPENEATRFFHIRARNLHLHKVAANCRIYLERVRDVVNSRDIPLEVVEFKWAGYTLPDAIIRPKSSRRFDAFLIFHRDPTQLRFNLFTDSTEFIPRIRGPGDFEMTYAVISENFQVARRAFTLHIGSQLNEIRFQQAGLGEGAKGEMLTAEKPGG